MVGLENILTRVVWITTDELHSYTVFIEILLLENEM